MTRTASWGMEEVPCSFQDNLSNLKVTWAEKLTNSIQFQRFRMIVFKVFHSISTPKVIQAICKVTRPAAAIKSLRCALSSIQSDFMSYFAMSYIVRRCCRENIS